MRVIGIIAEYNPFHKGHEYLISEARKRVGDPRAIVMSIMSGPLTQRGIPSVAPKHIRARQALLCGSNVVLELPFEWACAPASEFAEGAVKSLMATGVVTDIAWGIDCSSPGIVERLSDPSLYESEQYKEELRNALSSGDSFPLANSRAVLAVTGMTGDGDLKDALKSPNTILAIEYMKAIRKFGAKFKIHMIPREGQGYSDTDHEDEQEFYSASAIRAAIYGTSGTLSQVASAVNGKMPDKAASVMLSAMSCGKFHPADPDAYASRVISCPRNDIQDIRFMGDGLAGYVSNVLDDLRTGEDTFDALSSKLATKHFTMPRIYRALTMMILGIRDDMISKEPMYIRVLGFDHDGRYCLKIMGKCSRLPIIHNYSDFLEHSELKACAGLSLRADDLAGTVMGMPPGYSRDIPPVVV